MYKHTLRNWQKLIKPSCEWLYNCSEHTHLNDEWVPFSIGMGWTIINQNINIEELQLGTHDQFVFCAINPTTDQRRRGNERINREKILETLHFSGISNIVVDPTNYFRELPKYKFVISPEGNGIDCHRHYESLMAGCIPIIEDRKEIRQKYSGCPTLFTTDYSEITETYLNRMYQSMIDTEYDFSSLFLNTHSILDQQQIKDNGNYWGMRLAGKNWYSLV